MITALITGVSDGIGLELARIHIDAGHYVVGIGRRDIRQSALGAFPTEQFHYAQIDLSHSTSDDAIVNELARLRIVRIDCLYINAAIGYWGQFSDQSPRSIMALAQTNVISPLCMLASIHRYIHADSVIKVIGSITSRLPRSQYVVYAALKAAITAAVDAIRAERCLPGRIGMVILGAVRTNMHRKSGMNTHHIAKIKGYAPSRAAQKIYACRVGRRHTIIGARNRILFQGAQLREIISLLSPPMRTRYRSEKESEPRTERPINVFIIGAAQGIGHAIATAYKHTTARLYLFDINIDLLRRVFPATGQSTKMQRISLAYCDIGSTRAVPDILRHARDAGGIDRLYVPAAISAVGKFSAISPAVYRRIFTVNMLHPTILLMQLINGQLIRRGGGITLFSSLAHYCGYPGAACYVATKSYWALLVRGISRTLALTAHITVRAVFPGPTGTAHAERYSPYTERSSHRQPPATVASKIIAAERHKNALLCITARDRIIAVCGLLFPRLMENLMRKIIYEKIDAPLLPPKEHHPHSQK